MIKAVVFDAYGTLISTGTGSLDAAQKILDLHGSPISAKAFYADWKRYHRAHIDGLPHFVKEETIFRWDLEKLYVQYDLSGNAAEDVRIMLNTLGNRMAFPESKAVVEQLKRSVTVCIGSTTDTEPLMKDLARSGITVDRIFTSEDLQVYKPQKAFYETILAALSLPPEEVLFVGDSLTDDVYGPARAGMKTCWVNRKGQEMPVPPPDYAVADLTGVPLLLSALGAL